MKKRFLLTLNAVFVMISFVFAQENLILNYQFDNIDDPIWTINANGDSEMELIIDFEEALSGENSGFLEVVAVGENDWDIQMVQSGVPVEESTTYYLSFMAKVEDPFALKMVWELAADPYTKYAENEFIILPDELRYEFIIDATATDELANFKFFFGSPDNEGLTIYLDSIVLSEDPFLYGELTSIGDKKINLNELSVFPNPASDNFTVSYNLETQQNVTLDLYNITGQKEITLLNEYQLPGTFKNQFTIDNLSSGIYFLHLSTEKGNVVKKLIIQ